MRKRFNRTRFRGQVSVLPEIVILWNCGEYKYRLCFSWLFWGLSIGLLNSK